MAVIYDTTMTPGKLELLAAWLPAQPWYTGAARGPELTKSGGFRLDDPAGEVGMEFMAVTDTSGEEPRSYLVPVTYRGAPLAGADHALIGTSEHGVLGRRWVYDGAHDPVLAAQLLALLQGRAKPQHQSKSDLPEPSVTSHHTGSGFSTMAALTSVEDDEHGTVVVVETDSPEPLTIRLTRVLQADQQAAPSESQAHVTATWHSPTGDAPRTSFAVLYTRRP